MHDRPASRSALIAFTAALAAAVIGPCFAQPARLEVAGANRPAPGFGQRAEALAESGDFAGADEILRAACDTPSTRRDAAAALRSLHRRPGFRLRADETAVVSVQKNLGPPFIRRETPHFVILSDCTIRWTQARGDLLERTWAQFFRVADGLGLDAFPPRAKLLCILFDQRDNYLAFAAARDNLKSPWVGGYYSTLSNHIVFYNDASGQDAATDSLSNARAESRSTRDRASEARRQGDEELAVRLLAAADDLDTRIRAAEKQVSSLVADFSTTKTIHEAVHLLAFNTGVQRRDREYPFWLSEGLATAFESERPAAAFGPDRAQSVHRIQEFRRLNSAGKLPALRDLIVVKDVSRLDAETVEALYSQSHALFTHLYARNAAAMGRYINALSSAPIRSAADHAALFTSTFGNPDDIQARINAATDPRRPGPR